MRTARVTSRTALAPPGERPVIEDEADGDGGGDRALHEGGRASRVVEAAQLQRRVEQEERDPAPDEDAVRGDQPHARAQTPSTALTASRTTLTSRSTSAAVINSGGARNTQSPLAGCGPAVGRTRVVTPRFIISAVRRFATFRSGAKFFFVARSSTSSTAARRPLPPRMSPACGWSANAE